MDTTAAAGVVTLNPGAVLGSDTWNFGGVGSNGWRITGSASGAGLQAATPGTNLDFNTYNAGAVRIDAPILANGASGVRVRGTGSVIFSAANTYTGGTVVHSGSLEVATGGSINSPDAGVTIGLNSGDDGAFVLTGGTIISNSTTIGHGVGASGTVTLSGGAWTSTSSLHVGENGTGVLNITGGTLSTPLLEIGEMPGGNGTVTVSGGRLDASTIRLGFLSLTDGGNGVLTITDNGVVQASSTVVLPTGSSASGTLNIGTGGVAGTLLTPSVRGGLTGGGGLTSAVVNFNHTGHVSFTPQLLLQLAVNKLGSGTTLLKGENTYAGATTVSAGQLLFTAATSAVTTTTGLGLPGSPWRLAPVLAMPRAATRR